MAAIMDAILTFFLLLTRTGPYHCSASNLALEYYFFRSTNLYILHLLLFGSHIKQYLKYFEKNAYSFLAPKATFKYKDLFEFVPNKKLVLSYVKSYVCKIILIKSTFCISINNEKRYKVEA